MKHLFRTLVLAAALIVMVGCGGSGGSSFGGTQLDYDRLSELIQTDNMTEADIDELIDQADAFFSYISKMSDEEREEALSGSLMNMSKEAEFALALAFKFKAIEKQMTEKQQERMQQLTEKYEDMQ